jgi:hypothetical protein
MSRSESVDVGYGVVDLGWCVIDGRKTQSFVGDICVIWQYELRCCVIQITRYCYSVEWSSFDKRNMDLMHAKRGVKLVSETSQAEIKQAAVEALFGDGLLGERVLDVMRQCDEQQMKRTDISSLHGDITMSLGGYFEPFPFERRS